MKRKPKMHNEEDFDLDNINNEEDDYGNRGSVSD